MGVGLGRELQPRSPIGIARNAYFAQNLRIIVGVAHHRHVGPVLGRRTQHRGAPDVDVLDGVLHLHAGFGNRFAERVEVDADHVDEPDAVLLQRPQMLGIVAARQQTAVHLGMEGLDPSVADFGESRHLADVQHFNTAVAQQFHRSARGDHLPAQLAQAPGELHDAPLVANTD